MKMTEERKEEIRKLDAGEILDFQIRLQVECGLSHQAAADYISQAFED